MHHKLVVIMFATHYVAIVFGYWHRSLGVKTETVGKEIAKAQMSSKISGAEMQSWVNVELWREPNYIANIGIKTQFGIHPVLKTSVKFARSIGI